MKLSVPLVYLKETSTLTIFVLEWMILKDGQELAHQLGSLLENCKLKLWSSNNYSLSSIPNNFHGTPILFPANDNSCIFNVIMIIGSASKRNNCCIICLGFLSQLSVPSNCYCLEFLSATDTTKLKWDEEPTGNIYSIFHLF